MNKNRRRIDDVWTGELCAPSCQQKPLGIVAQQSMDWDIIVKRRIESFLMTVTVFLAVLSSLFVAPQRAWAYASHTQEEAVAYARSLIGQPLHSDNNGSLDCVDVARYYYDYLGVGARTGNGYDYARGNQPDGWSRVYSDPQPGDVATWDTTSALAPEWGHVAVVVAVSGSTIDVVQQDTGQQRNCWQETYSTNGWDKPTSYLRPDWPSSVVTGSEMASGYVRTIPDGDYAIVLTSTLSSSSFYYLDIAGTDVPAASGVNVEIHEGTGDPEGLPSCDLWTIKYEDGFYTISQKGTNINLDVQNASLENGTNVHTCVNNGNSAQKWAISKNEGGYRLESKCNGFSLDVYSGNIESCSNVWVYADNDSVAQRWSFVPVGQLCDMCEPILPDGDYAIVLTSTLSSSSFYYLDIAGTDVPAASGVNVEIHEGTGDPEGLPSCDLWTIKYEDGFYTISQKGTSINLDVLNASIENGANVQTCKSNGNSAQKWAITENGSGYRIESKCSGFSLDVYSGKIESCSNVWVYDDNDSVAQRWSFVPVGTTPVTLQTQTIVASDKTVQVGKTVGLGATTTGDGELTYESSDTSVATVSATGVITGRKVGSATIIITAAQTEQYEKATKDITVTVERATQSIAGATISAIPDQTWSGKAIEPRPSVTLDGKTLVLGTDYTLSYINNTEVGTATVVVTGIGDYAGSVRATFRIVDLSSGVNASWTRLAGTGRYDTMEAIVAEGASTGAWKPGAAVIATGASFPDALVASSVAGAIGAPVVLTGSKSLSAQAERQLRSLGVTEAYVMGGESAISGAVMSRLEEMGISSERIAGDNRQLTSLDSLRWLKRHNAYDGTIVVATGKGFADALAIGPWCYATSTPILLTNSKGALSAAQLDAMAGAPWPAPRAS